MVYTIVVHLQSKPVCPLPGPTPLFSVSANIIQDTVKEVKAKLIEAAEVYRKDKEVSSLKVGLIDRLWIGTSCKILRIRLSSVLLRDTSKSLVRNITLRTL